MKENNLNFEQFFYLWKFFDPFVNLSAPASREQFAHEFLEHHAINRVGEHVLLQLVHIGALKIKRNQYWCSRQNVLNNFIIVNEFIKPSYNTWILSINGFLVFSILHWHKKYQAFYTRFLWLIHANSDRNRRVWTLANSSIQTIQNSVTISVNEPL